MGVAEATAKQAVVKIFESEPIDPPLPNGSDWSHEKALHDWENEGGALGMPGSSFSA